MKNSINFTDYLNSCLKREPSLKNTSQIKMGVTINTLNSYSKTGQKHVRTKTDDFGGPETMSTTSVFAEGKLKTFQQEKRRKKTQSELELKKANSFKVLQPSTHFKSCSTYKSSLPGKDSRSQNQTVRSLQKLRKQIQSSKNPQSLQQQLKQINQQDKKQSPMDPRTGQYYLLSNDLLQTIKKLQKKHKQQLNTQKQAYQRREQKLVNKMLEAEIKNQRCTALINQLRIRNIDVDGIWHEEKVCNKVDKLVDRGEKGERG